MGFNDVLIRINVLNIRLSHNLVTQSHENHFLCVHKKMTKR